VTVLIDLGVGNLHSAEKAFRRMGADDLAVTSDPDRVARAERIVLPGDGAFPACRRAITPAMEEALREAVGRGTPLLGICVGMQLLATRGHEFETVDGLGFVPGEVVRITPSDPALKVPHMGWNDLTVRAAHPVLEGIVTGDHAYFVHSWQMRVEAEGDLLATADHGGPVTAVVGRDTVVGAQFHPEKSQEAGLRLIQNFLRWRP
jgi:imidazole glycerol-phosphate synthase subunit HisH